MLQHNLKLATDEKRVADLFKRACRGVNWGRPFVVRWQSTDGRFVIFTRPGHTDWNGIGSRAYFPATHYLCDLDVAVNASGLDAIYRSRMCEPAEGRLSTALYRFEALVKARVSNEKSASKAENGAGTEQ